MSGASTSRDGFARATQLRGARCDPLTITDAWSRYLLAVAIVPPRTGPVAAAVEAVFRRYGLPLALRSDNGTPFASTAAGGLSRLSARYRSSPRAWREPEEPVYDAPRTWCAGCAGCAGCAANGCIKWGGEEVFVSEALAGESVGIAETENGAWIVRFAGIVHFAGIDLGLFDRQSRKLLRFPSARPGGRKTKRTANTVTRITGP